MLAYCGESRNSDAIGVQGTCIEIKLANTRDPKHMDTRSSATYVRPWDYDTESPTFTPRSTCAAQSGERDWSITDARSAPAL